MGEVEIDRLYLVDIETICTNVSNEFGEARPERMCYSESNCEHLAVLRGSGSMRGSLVRPLPM